MSPAKLVEHGNQYPYDAPNDWYLGDGSNPPPPASRYHKAARGVIAELQDRSGSQGLFDNVEEETRIEIVDSLAEIIRIVIEEK